ncbi:hypothetical protein CCACVL1_27081 [Corchorus capsularis]|uniref:Uncharacterized protein n=1 Tax=Corchorus capsularis TaxID=210143 RepID=A0A1R3GCE8_COCAP|nr:hypothetical protein CCACVL1_27081 [Corchorus capsularis]
MEKISVANSRYSYINEGDWPNGSVDIHRVTVRKSFLKAFFVAIILLPIACCYFFVFSFKPLGFSSKLNIPGAPPTNEDVASRVEGLVC